MSVDLTTIISGGSGNLTFDMLSESEQHVTAVLSGAIMMAEVIEAHSAGTTIDSVSVTATALDAFLGLISLTGRQMVAADFDSDGDVDALDAFLIWQAATLRVGESMQF